MFYPSTCVGLRYGYPQDMLSGFSWKSDYLHCLLLPKKLQYFQGRLSEWICLLQSTPTLFNGDVRHPAAVSLLRLHIAPKGSNGILTVSAIALTIRLRLRTRLTPG